MVLCHSTSCLPPLSHLPDVTGAGAVTDLAAPSGPLCAARGRSISSRSDDRGRCSVKRTAIILAAALAVATTRCGQGGKETAPAPSERPAIRSVRITMAALHQAGGVPPGWRFAVPPGDVGAGRRTFADAGCPSCHRVAREAFPPPTGPGPELTGMGNHHPPSVLRRVDPHPRRRPGRRARLHRAGRALRHAELSGSDAPPARLTWSRT